MNTTQRYTSSLVAAFLLILVPCAASATPGSLDPTFGQHGFFLFPHEAYSATDVKIQSNGRILVSGDMAGTANAIGGFSVVRLLPTGISDGSFGSGGLAVARFGSGLNQAMSLAIQPDGKIVAAGVAAGGPDGARAMAIARFMPNGALDPNFGTNGTVEIMPAGSTSASAGVVLLLPSGKMLIGGAATFSTGQSGVVVRITPSGSIDPAFGTGGVAKTGEVLSVSALGLQQDGKIVALSGGKAVRFLRDGTFDPRHARSTLVAEAHFGASLLTADEKILEALPVHDTQSGSDIDTLALRVFPTGRIDSSFVSPVFDFLQSGSDIYENAPFAIALQADGAVLVAGQGQDSTAVFEGALARLSPSGPLDPSFGKDGIATSVLDGNDQFTALGRQPDGKIVAAGLSFATNGDLVVARYDGQ